MTNSVKDIKALGGSILPPNVSEPELALEAVSAASLQRSSFDGRSLYSAEDCPLALLPWLAWSVRADWSGDWPEVNKRAAIAAAMQVNRHRGTISSIKTALQAYGISAVVREGKDFTDQRAQMPYYFDCLLNGVGDRGDDAEEIVRRNKPLRTYFTVTSGIDGHNELPLASYGFIYKFKRYSYAETVVDVEAESDLVATNYGFIHKSQRFICTSE